MATNRLKALYKSFAVKKFTCGYFYLNLLECQIFFTSKYEGRTVRGLIGSSVNFTWSFSGNIRSISWGLKHAGIDVIQNNGVLVFMDKSGSLSVTVPPAYNGRVSGSGDVASGLAIFTLSSIKNSDERFYGCAIRPNDGFDNERFDAVHLVVEGGYVKYSNL